MGPAGPRPEDARYPLWKTLLIGPQRPVWVRLFALSILVLYLAVWRLFGLWAAVIISPLAYGVLLIASLRAERQQRLAWHARREQGR